MLHEWNSCIFKFITIKCAISFALISIKDKRITTQFKHIIALNIVTS